MIVIIIRIVIFSLFIMCIFLYYQNSPRLSGEEGVPSYKPGNDTVRVSMYNYGSPRVGNSAFADLFDKLVPDGFRVVVDGDIVSSVPYSSAGFKHVIFSVFIYLYIYNYYFPHF